MFMVEPEISFHVPGNEDNILGLTMTAIPLRALPCSIDFVAEVVPILEYSDYIDCDILLCGLALRKNLTNLTFNLRGFHFGTSYHAGGTITANFKNGVNCQCRVLLCDDRESAELATMFSKLPISRLAATPAT